MLKPGMMIGNRYEIIELVGSGGMSDVYKAKCHKLNRYVAVKVLKPEFSADKNFLTKFQIEAQSAAGLSHPNIVNVYDVGEDDGINFIVMELVEGITLKEYIVKNGRLPVAQAVDFAVQIASGIEAAHNNHTIHRDIKPQNIIVSRNGQLKVTDFGIARAATNETLASANGAVGSVHYISPEQARGGYCDERGDLYSLGITIYEMVTGRVPFDGENNVSVALQHIQGTMISPREYYPDIPISMEKVILKCTQKKPERRYLTAIALISDLQRVMSEPDGRYVRLMPVIDDSTTVMMSSDEVSKIKTGVRNPSFEERVPAEQPNTAYENDLLPEAGNEDEDLLEEEEKEGMDPKLEKLVYILGGVAAILLAMFIIFMIGKSLNLFKFGGKEDATTTEITTEEASTETTSIGDKIPVPQLVGFSEEDARKKIEDAGLSWDNNVTRTYEASSEFGEGYVFDQSIDAGEDMDSNQKIEIKISQGSSKVSVPNVYDMSESQAKSVLNDSGFQVATSYAYSDSVSEGRVMSQSPSKNTEVAPNTTVTITVSKGKEKQTVTAGDYVNMTESDAKDLANSKGLTLRVLRDYSDTVASGLVIRQDVDKNKEVEPGSVITVTISQGKKETVATYGGSVDLGESPIEGGETARLVMVLKQGSHSKTIFNDIVEGPFHDLVEFTVSSKDGFTIGDATVTVTVDGELWDTLVTPIGDGL